MTQVPLRDKTGNIVDHAYVDPEKFAEVDKLKWHILLIANKDIEGNSTHVKKYARARVGNKTIMMHHMVFKKPGKGLVIDHKNNNGLDNRLSNLRECTRSQNAQNVPGKSGGTSEYKGVCWTTKFNRWLVTVGGKYVGLFHDEKLAAAAYNYVAKQKYGDEAYQNDVDMLYTPKKTKMLPEGVRASGRKFRATLCVQGKAIYLGTFATVEAASEAFQSMKKLYQGCKIVKQNQKPITRNGEGIAVIQVHHKSQTINCLVDDDDWELVSNYKWTYNKGLLAAAIVNYFFYSFKYFQKN